MLAFLLIAFNVGFFFWLASVLIENGDIFSPQQGMRVAILGYLILSTIALVKKAGAGYFETYFKRKALEEALKIKSLKGDE